MNQFVRTFSYLKNYKASFAFALFLALLYTTSNVYFMPLVRDLIDEINSKRLIHFNNQIFNAIVLYGIRLTTQFSQIFIMTKISNYLVLDMKMDLYKKYLYQSQDFYSEYKLGDLMSRLASDVAIVQDVIIATFSKILPQTLTFIAILSYLFFLNWTLTLYTIVITPLFIVIISWAGKRLKRTASQVQRKSADITHITQEALSNIKLVQAYTMEEDEIAKFQKENKRSVNAILAGVKVKITAEPLISFIQFLAFAFVIWYGGFEVSQGRLTGSELAAFFTGIMLLIDPVLALSQVYTEIQKGTISMKRYYDILDQDTTVKNNDRAKKVSPLKGTVEFNDVTFFYKNHDKAVLKNISIEAKKGDIIALVGLSGSGKTTLINLIPRFYDISEGTLTIDGVDIKKHHLKTLRSQISIVPQEDIIFRGTIMENVRYGKSSKDIKEKDVIDALKQANAWEFIEKLPNGIYEKVGDKGRRLSGGQKQRISIARAILNDPRILILDEATSALDSKSESLVQDALNKLMKNRTTFVIAHRLSTIMHANKIIMLDNGEIAESGKHQELVKKDGKYAELYHLQFLKNGDDSQDKDKKS